MRQQSAAVQGLWPSSGNMGVGLTPRSNSSTSSGPRQILPSRRGATLDGSRGIQPTDCFRQEMSTQNQTDRLLLAVKGPASRGTDVIRRGHEQSPGEMRAIRFEQERVNLSLGDRSVGMIGLRLNGPQFSGPCSSDDVDPCISSPTIGPVFPEPDFVKLASMFSVAACLAVPVIVGVLGYTTNA